MKFDRKLGDGDGPDSPGRLTENRTPPARLTKKRTLQPFSGCGVTKNRTLPQLLTETRSLVGPGVAECAFP